MTLLQEAHSEPSSGNQNCSNQTSQTSLLPTVFKEGSTPPLSPRNYPLSPRTQRRLSGHPLSGSPLRKSSDPTREVIPQVSHRLAIDTDVQPSWLGSWFCSSIPLLLDGFTPNSLRDLLMADNLNFLYNNKQINVLSTYGVLHCR